MEQLPAVLFLHPSNELYGADRSLASLVRAVADIARPVVLLPNDLPYQGRLSDRLRAEGITVYVGPLPVVRRRYLRPKALPSWLFRMVAGTWWVLRLARREQAVGIITNTTGILTGPVVASLLRRPHIWYVREFVERPPWFRGLVRLLARVSRGCVVAVSAAVKDWLGPIADRGPVVVYNGVDIVSPVVPLGKVPMVVFVGRLNAWKGHDTYLDAASLVHSWQPDVQFRVVGGPVLGEEHVALALESRIRTMDPAGTWLAWDGELADARAAMRQAWVVAVPSTRPDPLPNVVLEAMAEGRAVVGSRLGGIPEMIADSETGFVVNPGDCPQLADALAAVVGSRDIAERLGREGRQRAESSFSRAAFVAHWRDVFAHEILGIPTGRAQGLSQAGTSSGPSTADRAATGRP